MKFSLGSHKLALLPEKAVLMEDTSRSLIVSDLHFGKAADLRQRGFALPDIENDRDIERLQILIDQHKPKNVYFLGDLFHNYPPPETIELFSDWIAQNSGVARGDEQANLDFWLIRGNHDLLKPEQYTEMGMRLEGSLELFPDLWLVHEFNGLDSKEIRSNHLNRFWISGHLHPGVTLRGRARQRIKLPAFIYRAQNQQLLLPAFGSLTGLLPQRRLHIDDRFFAIQEEINSRFMTNDTNFAADQNSLEKIEVIEKIEIIEVSSKIK